MIGRKLTTRLVTDGALNGQPIDKLTLIDVVVPQRPEKFSGEVETLTVDISDATAVRAAIAGRPDVIFHLAGVVSGEAELDFEKGMRVNLDGSRTLLEAIRGIGDAYRPRLVFTSSIAVYGAPFPDAIGDAKGGDRTASGRLHQARICRRRRHQAAEHRGAAGQAEQGGVGFLFRDHSRAARRARGGVAGR
jgi:nucleoside-diphosphate-sugar epimerase